jgi:hypothetical protein
VRPWTERDGIAVIRAWTEGDDARLKVRVTSMLDVTRSDMRVSVVCSLDETCDLVRTWLANLVELSRSPTTDDPRREANTDDGTTDAR